MATIQSILRRRLSELGLLQVDLARRLGVHRLTVTSWLSGRQSPSVEMLPRLLRELGISPNEFFRELGYSFREDFEDGIPLPEPIPKKSRKS